MHYPIRVLFLCTGNSACSPMAEALLRSFGGDDFEAFSAGIEPEELHPMAIDIMKESNIDISQQKSKPIDAFLGQAFDFIITVCDCARDNCPTFPGDNERIHWGFDYPAAGGDARQQRQLILRVLNEISERIRLWVAVQPKKLERRRNKFCQKSLAVHRFNFYKVRISLLINFEFRIFHASAFGCIQPIVNFIFIFLVYLPAELLLYDTGYNFPVH